MYIRLKGMSIHQLEKRRREIEIQIGELRQSLAKEEAAELDHFDWHERRNAPGWGGACCQLFSNNRHSLEKRIYEAEEEWAGIVGEMKELDPGVLG
jgi:hypothetical protein